MSSFYLIIFIIFVFAFVLKGKKIHVDFKSFFKRGFLMTDDMFGVVCYTGGQRKGKNLWRCKVCY